MFTFFPPAPPIAPYPNLKQFVCIGSVPQFDDAPVKFLKDNNIKHFVGYNAHLRMCPLWCDPEQADEAIALFASLPDDENQFTVSMRLPFASWGNR